MRGEWIEIRPPCHAETCPWRLSPCGESGLKWVWWMWYTKPGRSLPMRGEWIEMSRTLVLSRAFQSLPMRGEWIEIQRQFCRQRALYGLSPCGESGLKFAVHRGALEPLGLSPCGESGLKWLPGDAGAPGAASLPMRGEWIEIYAFPWAFTSFPCLSPCGESGLKYLEDCETTREARLSPCGESGLKWLLLLLL